MKCGTEKKETEFSARAWRTPADRVCTVCAKKPAEQKKCTKCGEEQGQAAFSVFLGVLQSNAHARHA